MTHEKYTWYDCPVNVVRIPKTEISTISIESRAGKNETIKQCYDRLGTNPEVLINCGFFGGDSPVFNLMIDHIYHSRSTSYQWGMGITDNNEVIYSRIDLIWNLRDFVSGFPVLLDDYGHCDYSYASDVNYKARRSVWGYDDNDIIFMTVDGPGVKFKELLDMCDLAGMRFAINLDGGGSTNMMVSGKHVTEDIWQRPVDSFVCVKLKEEPNENDKKQKDEILGKLGEIMDDLQEFYWELQGWNP